MNESTESTGSVCVLFVDDEENILNSIRRLMMDQEFKTLFADSGEKGLALLQEDYEVALIISDQKMPGLSGAEFLEKSREFAPDALRIILTGYADITATIDAINRGGAYRYLSKPWQDEELILAVQDGVRQYSLIMENKRLQATIKEWNAGLRTRILQITANMRVKNEELQEKNDQLYESIYKLLESFSSLVEARDSNSQNHAAHVAALSDRLAHLMNLDEREIEQVKLAALLHDIGKAASPDGIFRKCKEKMDEADVRAYRLHPVRGQQAIGAIANLSEVGILIRHHHESFDGSGFPDGLSGQEIPVGARILAVADFIDRAIDWNGAEDAASKLTQQLQDAEGLLDPALCAMAEKVLSDPMIHPFFR